MKQITDPCLLDELYSGAHTSAFAKRLFEKIRTECVIDIAKPHPELQIVPNNERTWNHMEHVVNAAIEHSSMNAVVVVQYCLNREDSLRETISNRLSDRRDFFESVWLPLLAESTQELTQSFHLTNSTDVLQTYVHTMLTAWQQQRAPKKRRYEDTLETL